MATPIELGTPSAWSRYILEIRGKYVDIFAPSCAYLTAFAEVAVEMKDDNTKFTMQLGGNVAWNVDTDLTGGQSTVVTVAPEEHDPFTLVGTTTYLKANPMAIMGGGITEKTVDGFLKGLC